jgi:glycosyltransferase involved in cell wall biosynthesis
LRRLAFVVQRYGPDVAGGSESLARAVGERLAAEYDVTVFTTCAVDYVTWRNELPEGETSEGGVRVRRYPVEEERDLAAFNRFSDALYARRHTRDEEIEWLRRQGPVAPRLVSALGEVKDDFHAVVFFTYLYYPTFWGLKAASERSLLVPTTHDEPPLRLKIFEEVFAAPRALAFLTPPEEALVRSRFDLGSRPAAVAGMGIDPPASPPDAEAFRARHGIEGPYAVYAGRIDAGKGCHAMLGAHARYRAAGGTAALVLLGRLAMDLPEDAGVRYLGYVSEDDKWAAYAGASVVVCPSAYESLSIALLEGFAVGTPALANAASPVLLDHCLRSNGGLYYADADEFAECLDVLVREERIRSALGAAGRRYVTAGYRWDVVLEKYRRLIDSAARR